MRVALDARTLQSRPIGGVGRVLAGLVGPLAELVDLELLTDARAPAAAVGLPEHPLRAPSARGVAWLQFSVPRWLDGFDGVFHCPFYGLPFRQPVPMVVTIHDLTFETHPEWFSAARRTVFRAQARHAARTARVILTDSHAVLEEVVERYGVSPERIVVAPIAIAPAFTAPDPVELATLGLPPRFIVALGGAPRRQLPTAVAAWRSVREQFGVGLVVVGPERPPDEPGIVHIPRPDDATWAALLTSADCLCYPTVYEGFGMPALEAMARGTPVVCAPVGALPEVLGDAGIWCRDTSAAAIAEGLVRMLGDGAAAARANARARAASWPTWSDVARVHAEAYARAASGQRRRR